MTQDRPGRIDFAKINRAALADLPSVLRRWLPDGQVVGEEFTALNPRRADRKAGSFKISIQTGKWADFATGDRGGDVVSFVAFIVGTGQVEAARRLAEALGIPAEVSHG